MKERTGVFITLEGGEGAGKSSLLREMGQHLLHQGYAIVETREPGGSKLGEFIRQLLLNRNPSLLIGHQAELLLFLAARAQHLEELIKPALEAGKVVLCDRFNDSTIAYQAVARGLDRHYVQHLCDIICGNIQPDFTFWLDVDPKVGLLRTQKITKENADKGHLDRIEAEKLEFHEKVREAFLTLAQQNQNRIHRIDANQPLQQVLSDSIKILNQRLKCYDLH